MDVDLRWYRGAFDRVSIRGASNAVSASLFEKPFNFSRTESFPLRIWIQAD